MRTAHGPGNPLPSCRPFTINAQEITETEVAAKPSQSPAWSSVAPSTGAQTLNRHQKARSMATTESVLLFRLAA